MRILGTALLFTLTACAEILGCYLPYLWLRKGASALLLWPAAACLAAFAWLLTLHPTYAAYGGVYIAVAVFWLGLIEGQRPDRWDLLGALLCLTGMAVIMLGPRQG